MDRLADSSCKSWICCLQPPGQHHYGNWTNKRAMMALGRSPEYQWNQIHCNAVITRVTGAIKSNRVMSDTAL